LTETELTHTLGRPFVLLERLQREHPEIEEKLRAAESASRQALVAATIHMLDTMDFHHMAEQIAEGHLDTAHVPRLRSSNALLAATPWPDPLSRLAASLRDELARLERALIAKDAETATSAAGEVHEKEHELSHSARDWLAS